MTPRPTRTSLAELARFALGSLREHRLRSALSMLGIGVGVAAVVLLTSVGEGARRYIVSQFTQFGTNLLKVTPGRVETVGLPGALGGTTRKLTIEDAEALLRVPGVQGILPLVNGLARVEHGGRGRNIVVLGATGNLPAVWSMQLRQGAFLPDGDPRRGGDEIVLGPRVKSELFGEANALGEFVRTAGRRLRVTGVMEPRGKLLGFDMDDIVYVPLATAMDLFNVDQLNEINVAFAHEDITERVAAGVERLLVARHGAQDFTVYTQGAMLEVFGRVMGVVTVAVSGIAGISLVVGAIGILTMMWISVGQRTSEIGLLRALGATPAQVQRVFLLEAVALATIGGALGLLAAQVLLAALRALVPGLPLSTPPIYIAAALLVSAATGLLSGVAPARRAAALQPVDALRAE